MSVISSMQWHVEHRFERSEKISQNGEVLQERWQQNQLNTRESGVLRDLPQAPSPQPIALEISQPGDGSVPDVSAEFLDLDTLILEAMFGRRLRSELSIEATNANVSPDEPVMAVIMAPSVDLVGETSGGSLRIDEKEQTEVALNVRWTDADGELRAGGLLVAMQRELSVERHLDDQQLSKMIDPLVLNFSGPVALSDQRISFDLTGGGQQESIATLASNSFYLALDKNANGAIDSGVELFGALTGNGFTELAEYDEDGNGFIDVNDSEFASLQLYRPGDGQLIDLSSMGVEGIYLESVVSPFQLQSSTGELLGQVRQTGFFYTDQGLGSIQHIDLAV